jgi:hypothetical protein
MTDKSAFMHICGIIFTKFTASACIAFLERGQTRKRNNLNKNFSFYKYAMEWNFPYAL